jgi:hypothetical protein
MTDIYGLMSKHFRDKVESPELYLEPVKAGLRITIKAINPLAIFESSKLISYTQLWSANENIVNVAIKDMLEELEPKLTSYRP